MPAVKDQKRRRQKKNKAVSQLVRPQQALVAMVIYLQVALTGFSVFGLIRVFTLALRWYNMYTAACIYKGNWQHWLIL